MNHKLKLNQKIVQIFWVFMIGSLAGFLFESVLCIIQKGYLESRQGVVYGPLTPIYGAGAVFLMLLLSRRKNIISIFFISALAGGTVEYLFSLFQQFFFGTISWDYQNNFNLFGRTSIFHCMMWGVIGLLFIQLVLPILLKILKQFTGKTMNIITLLLMVFMSINIIVSWGAASRQDERVHHIEASNFIDRFFDKHFPDERMDQIYANKKVVGR